MPIIPADRRDDIARAYLETKSIPEALRKCGIHVFPKDGGHSAVKCILRQRGIPYEKPNTRRWTLNERYFERIDSEEKAYWLGFIAADGCVLDSGGVSVGLASKDKGHLLKLRGALGSNSPLLEYSAERFGGTRYTSRLTVFSRLMANDLSAHGVGPRKSTTLKPSDIPSEYILPYLRGYFDGDGGICITRKFKAGVTISTTEEMGEFFIAFFRPLNVNFSRGTRPNPAVNNRPLTMGGSFQVRLFLDLIYKDAKIALDRKYDLYLEFIRALKERESQQSHYLYRRKMGVWYYLFHYDGRQYYQGRFISKHAAYNACMDKLIELGYESAARKLRYYHPDCDMLIAV
jgi:intein/homing endonuclease